jgi:hypothetical protein
MEANTKYPAYHDAKLNWDDLDWLKGLAKGTPIYLKGVCHIDVSRAIRPLWSRCFVEGRSNTGDMSLMIRMCGKLKNTDWRDVYSRIMYVDFVHLNLLITSSSQPTKSLM